GGPSSGKTTTVNLLRGRGYTTTIEHARHYIDLQRITGRSTAEVRARQSEFQRAVVDMQIEQEHSLDPQQTVFLDRALPDSLAYYRFLNLEPDTALLGALAATRYATVFLL
ncbi:ATP/GTP-binding protein, partial [Microbacterium sp. Leaf351]